MAKKVNTSAFRGSHFREASNKEIKLRKERDLYFTEKEGGRVNSVSARLPAYAGTALQAKHGGRKQNESDTGTSNKDKV